MTVNCFQLFQVATTATRCGGFFSIWGQLDLVTEWEVNVYSEFGFNLHLDDQPMLSMVVVLGREPSSHLISRTKVINAAGFLLLLIFPSFLP